MEDRLDCRPDLDGTVIITHRPAAEGESPPQVIARMLYDPTYAQMMAHSPVLFGTVKWVRTLLAQEACHCQPGVWESVVCLTDDLIAEIDQGMVP